jgi:uncharacterized membrane protein
MAYFMIRILHPDFSLPIWALYLLPFFATADWLTQALQWRESTTFLRILTGGLFGIWMAEWVCTLMKGGIVLIHLPIQIALYIALTLFLLSLKKGAIDDYLLPYEQFVEEYALFKKNKQIEANKR